MKISSNIELVYRIKNMLKKSSKVVDYDFTEDELIDIIGETIKNYINDGEIISIKLKQKFKYVIIRHIKLTF